MMNILLSLLLCIAPLQSLNDFKVGFQASDKAAGSNAGSLLYSPSVLSGGGWSSWIGDSNYWGLDYLRIALSGSYDSTSAAAEVIEGLDIRLAIQANHACSNAGPSCPSSGDSSIVYTPWLSQGGGWSSYTSGTTEIDAVRVNIEIQALTTATIDSVRVGVQLATGGSAGSMTYTDTLDFFDDSTSFSSIASWASDSDGANPQTVRIFLSADGFTSGVESCTTVGMDNADDGTCSKPLECWGGSKYHQVGSANADILGCGLEDCTARYDIDTIAECNAKCKANPLCAYYSWAPKDGDKNHNGVKVCTIYPASPAYSGQTWGPNQILCTPCNKRVK